MVLRISPVLLFALATAGCTCALSSPPPDAATKAEAGRGDDSGTDAAATDASVDALDAGVDAGRDADVPDADPNVYPCESDSDCNIWWRGAAYCLNGFCCMGFDVDGTCMCGDRIGGCPPGFTWCCVTVDSPDSEVCTSVDFCDFGGGP